MVFLPDLQGSLLCMTKKNFIPVRFFTFYLFFPNEFLPYPEITNHFIFSSICFKVVFFTYRTLVHLRRPNFLSSINFSIVPTPLLSSLFLLCNFLLGFLETEGMNTGRRDPYLSNSLADPLVARRASQKEWVEHSQMPTHS